MKASPENPPTLPVGNQWAPGAEPLAICMSCSSTYPPNFVECPNCEVALSIVRKCPSCGRVQSAYHVACIYCADSFIREDGLGPLRSGPKRRRRELGPQAVRLIVGVVVAVGIAVGAALYLTKDSWRRSPAVIGQTYALAAVAMRAQAATDAPPVKDLQPSEVLNVTDYTIDVMGNRWFRVASEDVNGFVQVQDVAPPKSGYAEKGFEILRHSLMGLEDPDVLPAANQAVDLYRSTFPSNPHGDELRWLLAERTRQLAGQTRQSQALLASARDLYREIARGGGEYAGRAREALAQFSTAITTSPGSGRTPRESSGLEFSYVGGSTTGSQNSQGDASAPVRRVTVVRRTPLVVRLTQPVQLVPGAVFQAEFADDIRVSREVAIPRGSSATGMVSQAAAPVGPECLRLTGATVNGDIYHVSADGVRVDVPGGSGSSSPKSLPTAFPAGTRVEFRLQSDLIITHR